MKAGNKVLLTLGRVEALLVFGTFFYACLQPASSQDIEYEYLPDPPAPSILFFVPFIVSLCVALACFYNLTKLDAKLPPEQRYVTTKVCAGYWFLGLCFSGIASGVLWFLARDEIQRRLAVSTVTGGKTAVDYSTVTAQRDDESPKADMIL